jgi:hypothetical protein
VFGAEEDFWTMLLVKKLVFPIFSPLFVVQIRDSTSESLIPKCPVARVVA